MTRIGPALLSAKAALELGPRELHDGGPPVHVVRGEYRVAKGDEEGAHLTRRDLVSRLDRRLAGHRRGDPFMARVRRRVAITGERGERLAQAALRVEARMRHRHRVDEQRVAAEPLDLEAEPREHVAVRLEGL